MIALDDRDIKMLTILQVEGRIPVTALAQRIALSTSACHERMRRLERAGVIERYGAIIAPEVLGPSITVFMMVELERHRAQDFSRFETELGNAGQVADCWAVGGGIDYVIRVIAEDIDAYQRFVDRLLDDQIGIARYFTYVLTKTVKNSPAPLWTSDAVKTG